MVLETSRSITVTSGLSGIDACAQIWLVGFMVGVFRAQGFGFRGLGLSWEISVDRIANALRVVISAVNLRTTLLQFPLLSSLINPKIPKPLINPKP